VLRKRVTLNLGMLREELVDDGLSEDEFVFVAVTPDLSEYEFIPGTGELITQVSIAARIEPLHVATKGKNWEFHKTDADPWPSMLHGHFYDARLKLDAITGKIYNSERQHCSNLKEKELRRVQLALLNSKDYTERARLHLGETRVAQLLKS
jgi:hypothetical protein